MSLREELQRNVEEFKRVEEKRKEQEFQERLKECKEVIEGIEEEMKQASLKGQTSIFVRRIEDTILNNESYANEIREYFERQGFKVKIRMDNAIASMCDLFNSFNSFKERIRIYYTIKISWEEEK